MAAHSPSRSLTAGSVPKGMLLFALPIFLSNLFQQMYNAVDSLIVGNFVGGQALAAVGSSGSLIFLLTGFVNGVSMGAGVLIARYFGAQDAANLSRAVHTTVALGGAAGLGLTAAGSLLTPQILRWMGTPAEVLPNSILYFRIYFGGCIAVVLYNAAAGILQAVGNSRSPMCYLIAASLTNVVLDLLFIARFGMGVAGAALATILSQTLSASLAFAKLFRLGRAGEAFGVRPSKIRFDGPMLREIVRLGVPSGVQNSVISIANVVVQANINAFGADAMAGCGAYSKVEGFAFLPVTCFSMALATFVSQNVGAGQPQRVKQGMRFGVACSAVAAECIGAALWVLAPVLIGAFNREPGVVAYGVTQMRTTSLFFCLMAFSHCSAGILRGLGRPTVPMAVMLSVWCVLRIIYITVTVHFIPDIRVIFWAYPLTWAISAALFARYLLTCPIPQPGGGVQQKHALRSA